MESRARGIVAQYGLSGGILATSVEALSDGDAKTRSRAGSGPSVAWTIDYLLQGPDAAAAGSSGGEFVQASFEHAAANDGSNYPALAELLTRLALGEQLKIKVPISTRTFTVKVDTFEPNSRLVWSDGNAVFRGVRTYTLTPRGGSATAFSMEEEFTGVMLPLIGLSLPDFTPVFEQYAADLKKEAERS